MESKKRERRAGILMPVSSLPSNCGIGTLGKGAYDFVDWLESAGMKIWQVLPLLPTGFGDSPYQSCSSDALNPYFIDFDLLQQEGLLEQAEYGDLVWSDDIHRVDYGRQFTQKKEVLQKAFARFDKDNPDWQAFLLEGKYADFALFMTLKVFFCYAPWTQWEEPYKSCKGKGLEDFIAKHQEEIDFWQFTQYIFLKQWQALKEYANEKNICIMGDMPIYLSEDSVETWKYRDELFMLDDDGAIALRAGVPPDAFSEDGQLWGNPVYDWQKHKANDYAWWRQRIKDAFSFFDILRIDHFRAFDRFFAVPAEAESAKEGEWLDGPKAELFKNFPASYEIIAEDLGVIDEGVLQLMQDTGYPGMKVFEFAFNGDPNNEYLPSNFETNHCVAYTGTHDNKPLKSFLEDMNKAERKAFETQLEDECLTADVAYVVETIEEECASIIELLFSSVADTVIIPMHDITFMGEEARLNAPSTLAGQNWTFRYIPKDFGKRKAAWIKELVDKYNR